MRSLHSKPGICSLIVSSRLLSSLQALIVPYMGGGGGGSIQSLSSMQPCLMECVHPRNHLHEQSTGDCLQHWFESQVVTHLHNHELLNRPHKLTRQFNSLVMLAPDQTPLGLSMVSMGLILIISMGTRSTLDATWATCKGRQPHSVVNLV